MALETEPRLESGASELTPAALSPPRNSAQMSWYNPANPAQPQSPQQQPQAAYGAASAYAQPPGAPGYSYPAGAGFGAPPGEFSEERSLDDTWRRRKMCCVLCGMSWKEMRCDWM